MMTAAPHGLSEAEAQARRAAGQGNTVQFTPGRTYRQIVRENVFNFINNLLFALGITLIILGRYLDALVSVGVVLANTVVSLWQEVRAKRTLDRIAILTRPKATVLRGAEEREIDPTEIVLGDVLAVQAGDQIVVDGRIVGSGHLEVDESLLTGESDMVPKQAGDIVYSGSFCFTGSGYYEAEKVGLDSLANRLTASAQTYQRVRTPLQREVNSIVRWLLLIVLAFEVLVVVKSVVGHVPFVQGVRMSTVIVSLVPNGLVLAIALAYALGAVRMAGKGALIQKANAVESLSNVDVLCTDKTGTLTSNSIRFSELVPLTAKDDATVPDAAGETSAAKGAGGADRPSDESGAKEAQGADASSASGRVARQLAAFAASSGQGNRTADALAAAFPGSPAIVVDQVPFSSTRKWSGLALDDDGAKSRGDGDAGGRAAGQATSAAAGQNAAMSGGASDPRASDIRGTFVLGAPEMIAPALRAGAPDFASEVAERAAQGLRVLLFAGQPEPAHFPSDEAGQPALPAGLSPLALISFSDELRPNVQQTLAEFAAAGIEVKVISGDNPQTVANLATQAGLGRDLTAVSGLDLAEMDDARFASAAEKTSIFGRVTPDQKERLVRALRARSRYVAMIGDGVNDVIALKQANVGIAMQGGSQAARGVADLILLDDSFAALPYAFREGQRILNGMQDILKIFLVRIFSKALIIAAAVAAGGFPFSPRQASLYSLIAAGIPTVGFAAWAISGPTPKGSLLKRLARFVVPATVVTAVMAFGIYMTYVRIGMAGFSGPEDSAAAAAALARVLPRAQTATTLFASLTGILLIPFTVPPSPFWGGGSRLRHDWRPAAMAIGLFLFLAIIVATHFGRHLFELTPLSIFEYAALAGAAAAWLFLLRWIWRLPFLDRILGKGDLRDAEPA
jgi:cation-transporting ATPase E